MAKTAAERQADYRLRHPDRIAEYKLRIKMDGSWNEYRRNRKFTLKGWATAAIDRMRSSPWVFSVESSDLIDLWRSQKGKCALTGMKMTLSAPGWSPTRPSVDRIDNKRGYHKDNIRLVWTWVNVARGAWSDEQLIKICRVIARKKEI